jgi:hypothetical protein
MCQSLKISSCSSVSRLFSPKFGPRVALGLHAHAASQNLDLIFCIG